jgi:hypothetical protein
MAAVAFDPLGYTHELEASGVPREQAEVHAKAMTAMFLHNFDALVTKDYLDTRFTEFETRVEVKMDNRFNAMETSVDQRFNAMETSVDKQFAEVDKQFTELESKMDRRFDGLELRFERIRGDFSKIYVMLGISIATATIPILQNLLGTVTAQ